VDQVVAVIEQDPLRVLVAFDAVRILAQLLQLDFDFVGDGLDLPGVGAAEDDEKIGKRGDFAEVEDLDILRLFRLGCRGGALPDVLGRN